MYTCSLLSKTNPRNNEEQIRNIRNFLIEQESVNLTADRLSWERETNRQLHEELERHEANRQKAIQQFEEDLQAWKEMHSEQKMTERQARGVWGAYRCTQVGR